MNWLALAFLIAQSAAQAPPAPVLAVHHFTIQPVVYVDNGSHRRWKVWRTYVWNDDEKQKQLLSERPSKKSARKDCIHWLESQWKLEDKKEKNND